jgi:gliding motility-associated protein GldM
MNVFYIGVDNPVSISAPGVPADKLKPSISGGGGSISKKGNEWIVRVKQPGTCRVIVNADVQGGTKKMGEMEFRVKRIPNPVPYVGGKTGSDNISLAQLKATSGIIAKMENFDFEVSVTVNSFLFSTVVNGVLIEEPVTGNRFNSKVESLINQAKRNQKVYFEKIMVRMPDGTVRELPPISLKIQ